MKKSLARWLAIGALALPNTASAEGINWAGFYFGVAGGYTWGSSDVNLSYDQFEMNPDGGFGGGFAGYNYMLPNNLIIGIETDINKSAADARGYQQSIVGPFLSGTSDLNWFGSTRLRMGYVFDRVLPFITAGVAYADLDYERLWSWPTLYYKFSDRLVGWAVGGGVEYAVADNWSVRAEYRYTDYGEGNDVLPPSHGLFGPSPHTIDLSTHDARLGISYRY